MNLKGLDLFKLTTRILLITGLVLNIVIHGQVDQIFYHGNKFQSYFFLNWAVFSSLIISYPMYISYTYLKFVLKKVFSSTDSRERSDVEKLVYEEKDPSDSCEIEVETSEKTDNVVDGSSGLMRMLFGSLLLCPFMFMSSYCWFLSINYAPMSIIQSLDHTQNIFVLIFSIILCIKEEKKYLLVKALIVIISFVGCTMISYFNTDPTVSDASITFDFMWIGICSAIFEAMFYALYQTLFVKFFGTVSTSECFIFQSLNGLFCLLFFWPPIMILDVLRVEIFQFSTKILLFLIMNSVFVIWYEVNISLALHHIKSPVYVSMSGQLVVFVMAIIDRMRGIAIHPIGYIGMGIVAFANFILNLLYITPVDGNEDDKLRSEGEGIVKEDSDLDEIDTSNDLMSDFTSEESELQDTSNETGNE